jgi:hypothetical protein
MIIRVYQIDDRLFLILLRISTIYIFFLAYLERINVEALIASSLIIVRSRFIYSNFKFPALSLTRIMILLLL